MQKQHDDRGTTQLHISLYIKRFDVDYDFLHAALFYFLKQAKSVCINDFSSF